MRKTFLALACSVAIAAPFAFAEDPDPHPGTAQTRAASTMRYVTEYPDEAHSPRISVLSGDPATTPISMLIRMEQGVLPMHAHSSGYQAIVVQGRMKHWQLSEDENGAAVLGPGSWWFQPANQVHTDACIDEAECIVYVHTDGKLDTTMYKAD